MASPDQQINTGSFVPTTEILDVIGRLQQTDVNTEEFKELIVRLSQQVNRINLSLNTRDAAFYVEEEFVNGQVWFNPNSVNPNEQRQAFRKVINFGTLPNNATPVTQAHGLTIPTPNTFAFTRIYGAASDRTNRSFIPIPYPSANAVADNLELSIDQTNVIITSGGTDYSAYTICYIVLEYTKF